MNWSDEPREVTIGVRSRVRGVSYRMRPLKHATLSMMFRIYPVNINATLSNDWPRPIVATSYCSRPAMLHGFGHITWQSAGLEWAHPAGRP